MPDMVSKFDCERRNAIDEEIYTKNLQPANLQLQVWDNNVVVFSFGIEKEIVRYRLCWGAFMDFVESIEEWFFDDDDTMVAPSCVDKKTFMQCTAHPDFSVSLAISIDTGQHYNVYFCADRSKFLASIDAAAIAVEKLLPNELTCFDETDFRVLH